MLTGRDLASFQEDGFLVVEDILTSTEVEYMRGAFEACERQWARELGVEIGDYRDAVSQWTNVWKAHSTFARRLADDRMAGIGRTLLRCARVQLFHDHLISKPGGRSSVIPWHQDYPFWPVDRPRALSCWLALDDAPVHGGALVFMRGAHKAGELPRVDFMARPKDWGKATKNAEVISVSAGTGIFHSCLSWHMSAPNEGTGPRRAHITIMMDADCRYDPAHSDWHPMNAYVTVQPGERFNENEFPLLGRDCSIC